MLFGLWRSSTVRPIYSPFMLPLLTQAAPDIHPLSLEDVLHIPGSPRSGADYYKKHLFIRVLSHTLNQSGQNEQSLLEQFTRSTSPEPLKLSDDIEGLPSYSMEDNRSSGFASKLSRKFKPPHKFATIEPGGYDVQNVDVSRPPQSGDTGNYGSFYATYVRRTSLPLLARVHLFDQGTRANSQQDHSQAHARAQGRWQGRGEHQARLHFPFQGQ